MKVRPQQEYYFHQVDVGTEFDMDGLRWRKVSTTQAQALVEASEGPARSIDENTPVLVDKPNYLIKEPNRKFGELEVGAKFEWAGQLWQKASISAARCQDGSVRNDWLVDTPVWIDDPLETTYDEMSFDKVPVGTWFYSLVNNERLRLRKGAPGIAFTDTGGKVRFGDSETVEVDWYKQSGPVPKPVEEDKLDWTFYNPLDESTWPDDGERVLVFINDGQANSAYLGRLERNLAPMFPTWRLGYDAQTWAFDYPLAWKRVVSPW